MSKPKEGRTWRSQLDMSSEAGCLMLRDLIHYKETGFNPFIKKTYESREFYESRPEYKEFSAGAFMKQVERMAEIAIAQMPPDQRRKEEEKIKEQTPGNNQDFNDHFSPKSDDGKQKIKTFPSL